MKKIGSILFMPVKGIYILVFIILLVIIFYIFYKNIEDHFMFFPQKKLEYFPADYHLKWEDIHIKTPDEQMLHGWFFNVEPGGPVILFCHGNAGNISHRLEYIKLLTQAGLNVLIFDYRGYGKSSGKPSEKGLYVDGLSAYDYLLDEENINPDDIILLGRSLGAAVAIEIATKRKARSLIVESGFLSTRHMARHMGIFSLISPLLPASYNNLEKIKNISIPKLVMHGNKDEVVPFLMGERLFDAANSPKYFYPIEGAGHNDTYVVGGAKYVAVLNDFIRDSKINDYR